MGSGVFPLEPEEEAIRVAVSQGTNCRIQRVDDLTLSITMVRRSDGKYMRFCLGAAVSQVQDEYISFDEPPLPECTFADDDQYFYFIYVDELTWDETGPILNSFEVVQIALLHESDVVKTRALLEMWEKLGEWV